jgi:hypothetical protein
LPRSTRTRGDEPTLTLCEDLDDATEYLLLTTVTSLAVVLECAVFDLHGWSLSDMNVQVRTCDGLLAPYRQYGKSAFTHGEHNLSKINNPVPRRASLRDGSKGRARTVVGHQGSGYPVASALKA